MSVRASKCVLFFIILDRKCYFLLLFIYMFACSSSCLREEEDVDIWSVCIRSAAARDKCQTRAFLLKYIQSNRNGQHDGFFSVLTEVTVHHIFMAILDFYDLCMNVMMYLNLSGN